MSTDIIRDIRREGEEFLRALNRELYQNLAGLKRESNLRAIYKSHLTLGDPDLFFSLKKTSPRDEEEETSLKLLSSFIARIVIENRTAKIRDQILTEEGREEIQIDRRAIPYRAAAAEIKREPKKTTREEIEEKGGEKTLKLNPLILEALDIMHGTSAELGFPSFVSLCGEAEGLSPDLLEEKAKLFLDDTEYVYRDLLKWFLLKRMEMQLKDAKSYDLRYLFNSSELRANFPKADFRSLTKTFLDAMGIEFGENIREDLEHRKGKVSQSFCLPIEVPQNIVISIYPVGGIEDYESFFHELGIALFYGYREREDEFEFRRLGESASEETFGVLFENMLLQPKWLKKYLRLDTIGDFLNFLHLRRLAAIRCLSGKLIYELSLHKDEDFRDKSDFYKQTLKKATLCEYSESDYLNDVDPFLRTASSLKAYIIEVGLELYLRENFDEEWWRERGAGDFLLQMWRRGGRVSSEEISKTAGFPELSLAPLLGFFKEVLG